VTSADKLLVGGWIKQKKKGLMGSTFVKVWVELTTSVLYIQKKEIEDKDLAKKILGKQFRKIVVHDDKREGRFDLIYAVVNGFGQTEYLELELLADSYEMMKKWGRGQRPARAMHTIHARPRTQAQTQAQTQAHSLSPSHP
jgi:hypothetical protein